MDQLLTVLAAVFAAVGGITLFVALFTPKRFVAKRPARFVAGFVLFGLSALLYFFAAQS